MTGTRFAAALLAGLLVSPVSVSAQELTARVWLDQGDEPVLERGNGVRVYYRSSEDSYVAIFRMDTNGSVQLLYPRAPDEPHHIRGERDYRLIFPRSSDWRVDDDPGVGYHFIVASPWPLDFSAFRYSPYAGGWDLSAVAQTVYSDPYVAMDDFVVALIPGWEYDPYALDFSTYNVGAEYDYPRFLCYDCHGFRSYETWNPYLYSCSTFQVVIYDDPFYYPVNRYRGTRVVYTRPPVFRQPRFTFKKAANGRPNVPIRTSRPAGAVPVSGPDRSAVPRRSTSGIGSGGSPGTVISPRLPGGRGTVRPTEPRGRPTIVIPRRSTPTAGSVPRSGTRGGSVTPPARSSGSGSATPPTTRRGGGGVSVPTRSSGSGTARAPARSTGSSTTRPPTTRRGGGGVSVPTRSSGSGTARVPTTRRGGGGTATPTRSSGRASPPARSTGSSTTRPPPTRRGGGGGPAPLSRSV